MSSPPVSRRQHIGLLTRYLGPQRGLVSVLAVLLISSTLLQLVNPQVLRSFVDAALAPEGNDGALTRLALGFIAVALLQQALSVTATYFSERVGWTATNALRTDLALHCLRLDLGFHKARTPGELIERIDGDVTALANFFSQLVIQVIGSILLLLGVLVVLWVSVDWRVSVAFSLYALVVLLAMVRTRAIAVPYWTRDREVSADLFGYIEERLAGTVDIRSSGAQDYVMLRLYERLRERLRVGSKARVMGTWIWTVPVLAFAFGNGLAFALGAYLVRNDGLSLGGAFAIYFYMGLLFWPLNVISNQIDAFQKAGAGIVRIHELFDTRSALPEGPAAAYPQGALAAQLDRVTFAYEPGDPVLHDVSFHLSPGETVGLLGRTGSGKTTIGRLLLRLYDPTEGAVRVGGVDLRAARLDDVRRAVGVVTQDVQLFRATLRENLTFFDAAAPDERIHAALAELGLDAWVRGLPDGLDTMVEAGGAGFSAGEAQLLAFARVFLRDPGVVILDEASSRLDPATEALIERAVDRLLEGRTGIIIAHRLATVARVDRVMILERGEVVEEGPRAALAADPSSRFRGLLRTGLEGMLA